MCASGGTSGTACGPRDAAGCATASFGELMRPPRALAALRSFCGRSGGLEMCLVRAALRAAMRGRTGELACRANAKL
eukprot:scaffold13_cov241-Pinguiococcus_pyrenoidosus.AAC.7